MASSEALPRELAAPNDLPNPDPIDEIKYKLDIEPAAKKPESYSSFVDDAPEQPDAIPANNMSDLFELLFRRHVRLAFFKYGN